jgi:hypothetical protein
MRTLYESLLDDEEDLLDAETTVIQGLLNKELLLQSRDVFYNDVKKSSKKIGGVTSDKIKNDQIFQPKKVYVLFRPKYPEQITLLYKPDRTHGLYQMNTSYVRNRGELYPWNSAHGGRYRWVTCKSYLRIVSMWYDNTYELYELPKKYYPLWNAIHSKINPSDKTFDIK